ncbi:glycosyltransferase family 4 protein [Gordonia tangerina]|uniref:Glycosyltransferase family 4 protein n=1 Tax=Gordonia tangerina TaxID=2911060 RepID=A0ABS9DM00_9ACTN|nr:glycosyltransferase family 4 protein [Gordonia tangerina]MCF3940191.1 glycosyltransferase family 4 protein [Gordonia tangerina]
MHIAIVTPRQFGDDAKGGGERYVTELSAALKKIGISNEVLEIPRLRSWRCDSAEIGFSELWSRIRKADVLHIHQLNSPGFDIGAVIARINRVPIVLTDHGGGFICPGRLLGRARLLCVSAAAYVSAWSSYDIDPHKRIRNHTLIYGGGDHVTAAPEIDSIVDFAVVGRILPHKGAHIAIEALPDSASLRIVGQVRDSEYYKYLARIAEGKRVTFVPDADDAEVAQTYKDARYILCPSVTSYGGHVYSRPELLGLVALESLAVGTPVIGSRVGGLAETLERFSQQTVEAGSVKAWRETLQNSLTNQASSESVNARGEVTWESVAVRCQRVYSSVLQSRRGQIGVVDA